MTNDSLAVNLEAVKDTIQSKSPHKKVHILIVSKYQPVHKILALYSLGERSFGENYVQELVEKARVLPSDINWSFIGHLQRNKCMLLLSVPNIKCISTVDSILLAQKLNNCCSNLNRTVKVMVQIKTEDDPSKNGVPLEEVESLVTYIVSFCTSLELTGFLTMAPTHATPHNTAQCFSTVSLLRQTALSTWDSLRGYTSLSLSMGMTKDMTIALQYDTDEVRIGTSIFGARPVEPNSHASSQVA